MPKAPVFTTIIDTYYRPALLREAVAALQRQTYENVEIILVNNGATEETIEYLHEVADTDSRVKLIHFQENQFSFDDPHKRIDVCLNAGLRIAEGDYIWYHADDDLIADDYAEKMVALFQGNSECTTAAGIPVAIDAQTQVISNETRTSNYRPRYMPGNLLALDNLRGGRAIFRAPGQIFTIRRDVLVKAGGFHRSIVLSQLYGIVPFGITGFDESAVFYWRYHDGQLGKKMSAWGWIGIDEDRVLLKEWEIERRWQEFGAGVAKEVVSTMEQQTCQHAADWFLINLGAWRFPACFRLLRKMWRRSQFWTAALAHPKQLFASPVWHVVKPPVRWLFRLWPRLGKLVPGLASVRHRVNR
jgi:glycosyltransferase involved in cell wall biosynthesis